MDLQNGYNGAEELDLIGTPFSVLESDPGLFTMLLHEMGVEGLEVTEVYDIAPWAIDHLSPRGLIFCYLCPEETQGDRDDVETYDAPDADAEDVWFANQLADNACASQALLNVVLNCENIDLGERLGSFLSDTCKMSPEMKGLAITNSPFIRHAHNSFTRPADTRASYHAAASSALKYAKSKKPEQTGKRKSGKGFSNRKKVGKPENNQDAYHFIGYVPRHGKVWELDGLRFSGPLEVGEISPGSNWINVLRPVLKMRMQRFLSGADENTDHIKYNLLAVVEDKYRKASDEMEMLKRERAALERRLQETYPDEWSNRVRISSSCPVDETFTTSVQPDSYGPTFSKDFGARKMEKDMAILDMPARRIPASWEACVQSALSVKLTIEEEVEKAKAANTENLNRIFDYEPLFRAIITSMHAEGTLDEIISPPKMKKTKR
ncbi:cysteine proteinase [Cristinia sonorae]|uniref:ubiquitinyl hydrolase 1 n=1 Tax=Cristinia sonorae TaxID=1940300 RepID=A0A8K0XTZ4_9AGAR|nr:cysteine proteinase [Cristinia sonorae]